MKIIITGFGPFLSNKENPSGEIASSLGGEILEVSYSAVDSFLKETDADALLCLGLSNKIEKPQLEIRAHNKVQHNTPDMNGVTLSKNTIEGRAKERYTILDVDALHQTLLDQGYSCSISTDPGLYLCNYLYFKALGKTKGNALFVHLPPFNATWTREYMKTFITTILDEMNKVL